tara:strand:+ start:129 stop:488 length:360 start_codon:yes stop_codon:yes gene_type:complete
MITGAAIKAFAEKAIERIKTVPVWVWAVVGWILAFLAWQAARRSGAQKQIQDSRLKNMTEKAEKIIQIREDLSERIKKAEAKHRSKMQELTTVEKEIDKKASDPDLVSDAVNDAFGDKE